MQSRYAVPWCTLGICVAAVGIMLMPSAWHPFIVYDRAAIIDGEWWRLLSGHLAHWSLSHMLWDVLALFALGVWCETQHPKQCRIVYGISAIGISLLLLGLEHHLLWYCGLSGVVSALVASAARGAWIKQDLIERMVFTAFFIFVFIKVVLVEMVLGQSMFANMGEIPSVPMAHLAGLIFGLLCYHPRERPESLDFAQRQTVRMPLIK